MAGWRSGGVEVELGGDRRVLVVFVRDDSPDVFDCICIGRVDRPAGSMMSGSSLRFPLSTPAILLGSGSSLCFPLSGRAASAISGSSRCFPLFEDCDGAFAVESEVFWGFPMSGIE